MRNELFLPLLLESYFTSSPTEKNGSFWAFLTLESKSKSGDVVPSNLSTFMETENSRSLLELTENTEESYGYIHSLLNEYQLTFSSQIILNFEYSWNEINSDNLKNVHEI